MTEETVQPIPQSSAELAQEILRKLHEKNIEATPEAYEAMYNELTGVRHFEVKFDVAMLRMARLLAKTGTDKGLRLASAIENDDWAKFSNEVVDLVKASVAETPKSTPFSAFGEDTQSTRFWRDLLSKTMTLTLPGLLHAEPTLAKRAERLGNQVKEATLRQEMVALSLEMKSLYFHINLFAEEASGKNKAFIKLLYLLMESVLVSLDSKSWITKEIYDFQAMLKEPLDQKQMEKVSQHIRDIVLKQKDS
ncbi:hypothetical protein A7981_10970 [Methylovorus sp. MM2]|uniref:hypothetical protein n=1 Tax=Methylovorus sp. MM2 TaxID=1848038 RepID=UPI0007E19640|nr:hypothetical protein [Methylovorus sp. MM2]OAM51249.1 hypothetical protein A7981_10970 [Methylovorus sp. MM2]